MMEENKPVQAKIVRVHDYFWLRLWRNPMTAEDSKALPGIPDVEDMVCALAAAD
jgi:hypothetical protein